MQERKITKSFDESHIAPGGNLKNFRGFGSPIGPSGEPPHRNEYRTQHENLSTSVGTKDPRSYSLGYKMASERVEAEEQGPE